MSVRINAPQTLLIQKFEGLFSKKDVVLVNLTGRLFIFKLSLCSIQSTFQTFSQFGHKLILYIQNAYFRLLWHFSVNYLRFSCFLKSQKVLFQLIKSRVTTLSLRLLITFFYLFLHKRIMWGWSWSFLMYFLCSKLFGTHLSIVSIFEVLLQIPVLIYPQGATFKGREGLVDFIKLL